MVFRRLKYARVENSLCDFTDEYVQMNEHGIGVSCATPSCLGNQSMDLFHLSMEISY